MIEACVIAFPALLGHKDVGTTIGDPSSSHEGADEPGVLALPTVLPAPPSPTPFSGVDTRNRSLVAF